jgi:hypothetical protein
MLVILTPLTASANGTNDYTKMVANSLRNNPVYVDRNASPTLTADQRDQLSAQIRATGKPIYLILVDNTETKKFSGASAFLKQVHNDLGSNGSHVIGVSTSKSFSANGYNLPRAVADQAGPLTGTAMKNGGKNPYQVFSYWVGAIAKIQVPSGTTTRPSTNPAKSSTGGGTALKVFLIILGAAVLILLVYLALRAWFRKKDDEKDEAAQAGRLERRADTIDNGLMALLPDDLQKHPDADAKQTSGLEAVRSARTALAAGDTADAEGYLKTAQRHLDGATAIIEGRPVREKVHSVVQDRLPNDDIAGYYQSSTAPSMANNTVRVQRPEGGSVTINHNNYSQFQAPGFGYHYGGGMYGGQYWAPGYYSDPFWNYLVLSEVLDHDHDYEHGYEAGRRDDYDSSYRSEGTAAGTDWGTSSVDTSQAEVVDEGQASGTDWGSNDSDSQSDNSGGWGSGDDSNNNDSGWSSNDDSSNNWGSDSSSDTGGSSWDSGGDTGGDNSGW